MAFWDSIFGGNKSKGKPEPVNAILKPNCDIKFVSNKQARRQNGHLTAETDENTYRGVRIEGLKGGTFRVSIYMMEGKHPLWGDNMTMAPKIMRIKGESEEEPELIGVAGTSMFDDFSDYGITIRSSSDQVDEIVLHLHDRDTDIAYLNTEQPDESDDLSSDTAPGGFELVKGLVGMSQTEDFADQALRAVVMEEHPYLYNCMGVKYLELGCTNKALSCFLQGAKVHTFDRDNFEEEMVVLGVGQCLTNLTTHCPPSDFNASYKATKFAYFLLSQAINQFELKEAHLYRATLFAGHELPITVQNFLRIESDFEPRLEPCIIADFYAAAMSDAPPNLQLLQHASGIHASLGNTIFSRKNADGYELKEFVKLGRVHHQVLYSKTMKAYFSNDLMLSKEDFEGLVVRGN